MSTGVATGRRIIERTKWVPYQGEEYQRLYEAGWRADYVGRKGEMVGVEGLWAHMVLIVSAEGEPR